MSVAGNSIVFLSKAARNATYASEYTQFFLSPIGWKVPEQQRPRLIHFMLGTQILPNIRLVKNDNGSWLKASACYRALTDNAKPKWNPGHIVYNNTSILWSILSDTTKSSFCDIMPIKERHFTIRFNPHLVFCILRKVVQTLNCELKLSRFRKLAKQRAYSHKFIPPKARRMSQLRLAQIVHPAFIQPKHMPLILAVNQPRHIVPYIFRQFTEHRLGLILGKWTHDFLSALLDFQGCK
mmetsp:Transcript_4359/g.6478  ORF Transcript_4359/g.6478 Transcript_4359/m.6478 type:complete len:238 (-) Transcript_4359:624-1337(-)